MTSPDLPLSVTLEVRDRCLCLHVQRAARRLARRFDEALRPFGLTNGQFSLLMSLNRPEPPRLGDLAPFLGMDRTTLTAALKPLQKRGLVLSATDKTDARARRLALSEEGRKLLVAAVPAWRAAHDAVDAGITTTSPEALREALRDLR
ncbi:MarR family winged helix-turn-helix transcriptional regulator [Plastorhodobacter daqingensis]|uniref:MarR family winged helix-turn-helix transcriptional regulator n=1 Tax=Plastorhodobacter daqingensis TaxID=1387281 RepID=A0ABW2UKC5_9RHOB